MTLSSDRGTLRILINILVLLLISPAVSSKTKVDTNNLLDIYEQARLRDPTLQFAYHNRKAHGTFVPETRGAMLPQLSTTWSQFRNRSDNTTIRPTTHSEHNGVTIDLEQAIYNASLWYDYKRAGHIKDKAQADYLASSQDLMIRVANAYFNILKAQDTLHFISAERLALARQLEQTQQQYRVGLAPITDVKEAKARHDTTVADEIKAKNDLQDREEELEEITGAVYTGIAKLLADTALAPPEPNNMQDWVYTAIEYSPTLASAELAVKVAKDSVCLTKAEHLPTLNIVGSYGRNRLGTVSNPDSKYGKNWSTRINLAVNIFSGGSIQARVHNAQYQYLQARDSLEKARRETRSDTRSAFRGVLTAIGQVNAFSQAVISAQTALEATQAAYDVGTRTSVDVLDSISDLYERQQRLAEARYDYILNQLSLKQAAGVLTVADLQQANSMLDF